MDAKNRRRHTRVRARNIAAHLRVDEKTAACQVEDISQGGLFLRTDQRMPVGLAVVIDLARPGLKRPLRLSGVVAQHSDARKGIGIRFDPLDEDSTLRLAEILRDLGAFTSDSAPAANNPFARRPTTQTNMPAMQAPPPSTGAGMAAFAPSPTQPVMQAPPASKPQVPDDGKLMIQIKGLLMELGQRERALSTRDKELQDAQAEIERLKNELRRRDDRLYALEQALAAGGGNPQGLDDVRAEIDLVLQHAARLADLARRIK